MARFIEKGRRYGAELAALLVVTIWGTNFVFQKAALSEFDVYAFTFLRFVGMVALSWLILWARSRRSFKAKEAANSLATVPTRRRPTWANVPRLVGAGVLGYTLYMLMSIIGLSYTTAFSGALLIGTSPLFAAVLLWLFQVETVKRGQWTAMLLALVGVFVFLLDKFEPGVSLGNIGDLISLAGAFFFAAYSVANKPLLSRYPGPTLTAYTLTIGAIPVLLLTFPALLSQDWNRIRPDGWLALGWSIVFPVYFAWTVWGWVNQRLGVARTATFMFLVPIIGGVTSWLLLGESFGFLKLVGAGITLLSLVLVRRQHQGLKPRPIKEAILVNPEPQLQTVQK